MIEGNKLYDLSDLYGNYTEMKKTNVEANLET